MVITWPAWSCDRRLRMVVTSCQSVLNNRFILAFNVFKIKGLHDVFSYCSMNPYFSVISDLKWWSFVVTCRNRIEVWGQVLKCGVQHIYLCGICLLLYTTCASQSRNWVVFSCNAGKLCEVQSWTSDTFRDVMLNCSWSVLCSRWVRVHGLLNNTVLLETKLLIQYTLANILQLAWSTFG